MHLNRSPFTCNFYGNNKEDRNKGITFFFANNIIGIAFAEARKLIIQRGLRFKPGNKCKKYCKCLEKNLGITEKSIGNFRLPVILSHFSLA